MTTLEIQDFIKFLKDCWPDWDPTDREYARWSKRLERCEFYASQAGVEKWLDYNDYQGKRPLFGKLKPYLKAIQSLSISKEPITLYGIQEERSFNAGLPCTQRWSIPGNCPLPMRGAIEDEAERMRQKLTKEYPNSHWIIIFNNTNNEADDEYIPATPEEMDQIKEEILFGPDSPAKRFLQSFNGKDLVSSVAGNIKSASEAYMTPAKLEAKRREVIAAFKDEIPF